MSSDSDRRALVAAFAIGASTLAAAACSRTNGDNVALAEPPPMNEPVGPIPGPKVDAGTTTNPFGQDPITLNQGHIYFLRYNCAGCHGDHGGGGMGPSLRDVRWRFGSSDERIFASIAQGRGHGMPAWGAKLPEEIVWKLVAYIKSMRTPLEPQPPDETIPAPPQVP